MIKVMVCDDEGIVRQSLRFIIDKAFGEKCQVEEAKSGRSAIELAQSFRPDIAFMDIQMPGINGIDAMKEMQRENPKLLFIVLTAYDKFGYAKDAIELGVLEYLTKPIGRDEVVTVLRRAMKEVENRRRKNSQDLEIKEKLETVIPMLETGFINSIVMQESSTDKETGYESLLGIEGQRAFIEIVEFGEDRRNGSMTNPVGSNVKMQKCYTEFREIAKEFVDCIVGGILSNKIIICVPTQADELDYDDRVKVIETMRAMIRKLEQRIPLKFKAGIGSIKPMALLNESYREALAAVRQELGKVTHIKDVPIGCDYEEVYPHETENLLFEALNKGNLDEMKMLCEQFMEWMQSTVPVLDNNVRLKAMEFVLRAEEGAYRNGGLTYRFGARQGFLEEVLACKNYDELRQWFLVKMTRACRDIMQKPKEKNESVVEYAKQYIRENYFSEMSLEDISRELNISPYYFSKLFKEEAGVNYIEFLTKIRIEKSKEMLKNPENSIKAVCVCVGYSDPNYFSRIFKKWVGQTPTEYREENLYE